MTADTQPPAPPALFSDGAREDARRDAVAAVMAADPHPERQQPGADTYAWWEVLCAVELATERALSAPLVRQEVREAVEVSADAAERALTEVARLAAALAEAERRIAAVEALDVPCPEEVAIDGYEADGWDAHRARVRAALAGDGGGELDAPADHEHRRGSGRDRYECVECDARLPELVESGADESDRTTSDPGPSRDPFCDTCSPDPEGRP